MAKMGRPKSDNPKKNVLSIKLTDGETERLRAYASKHDMTITQVLQRGLDIQYEMEKETK